MAKWAETKDVQERLGITGTAKGYTPQDVSKALERAEKDIRSELQTLYDADTLNGWTLESVPETLKNTVADLAAAYIFAGIFGQSLKDNMSQAGSHYGKVQDDLKKIRLGQKDIVDRSGDQVSQSEDSIYTDKANRTPIFSTTHPDDSDAGEGSLDNF